jgi:hypothetical protein
VSGRLRTAGASPAAKQKKQNQAHWTHRHAGDLSSIETLPPEAI